MEERRSRMKETKQRWGFSPAGWKDDLIVFLLLIVAAFWLNRKMELKGLYMDDLYLWSCYKDQSFLEYVFPLGGTRFRFLYYLASWIELAIIGTHVSWIVPINILLNVGVAFTLYRMAKELSHSAYVGGLLGVLFLASRMSYYQIGQLYGLMETMALWMAIGLLYLLFGCLSKKDGRETERFVWAGALYFGICFVHERYMVLLPLFFLVLIAKKVRNLLLWGLPILEFLLVQLIRFVTIGSISPAGTGGTDVQDTFTISGTIRDVLSQIAYLFGINAGPEHLNGQNFRQSPVWVMVLIGLADLALLLLVAVFLIKLIADQKHFSSRLAECLLFVAFIGGCMVSSSVTIRVEMRWVYVSFAAALLFLSYMYGEILAAAATRITIKQAAPYLGLLTLYVAWMLPVEVYYRGLYPNLYYWENQSRYNSLAEETYEIYGDDLFGKTIYMVGNSYEMSDFTAETFFQVYDEKKLAEGTTVVHIDDVREIGLITDEMIVLQEMPKQAGFLNITEAVKQWKCRRLYGYYEDGWLDERAELVVMAGASGEIHLDFVYPKELQEEQWITVYVADEPEVYLKLDQNEKEAVIYAEPYEVVHLRTETNFYVPEAQEKRGETRLALLLTLTAD